MIGHRLPNYELSIVEKKSNNDVNSNHIGYHSNETEKRCPLNTEWYDVGLRNRLHTVKSLYAMYFFKGLNLCAYTYPAGCH
jgi:hypothetical protein